MNFLTRLYLFFYVMTAAFSLEVWSMEDMEIKRKLDMNFSKEDSISNQVEMSDPYSISTISIDQKTMDDYFTLRLAIHFTFVCFNLFITTLFFFFYKRKIIYFIKINFKNK